MMPGRRFDPVRDQASGRLVRPKRGMPASGCRGLRSGGVRGFPEDWSASGSGRGAAPGGAARATPLHEFRDRSPVVTAAAPGQPSATPSNPPPGQASAAHPRGLPTPWGACPTPTGLPNRLREGCPARGQASHLSFQGFGQAFGQAGLRSVDGTRSERRRAVHDASHPAHSGGFFDRPVPTGPRCARAPPSSNATTAIPWVHTSVWLPS